MKITFAECAKLPESVRAVIHSLDQALYQVTLVIEGEERLLAENSGRPFRRHSLQAVREALRLLPLSSLCLRQLSAYDEMVGQPVRESSNALEVPLALDDLPPSLH